MTDALYLCYHAGMSELNIYEDLDRFDEIFGDLDMTMLHSDEKHSVFVYGTLMSGMRNHSRLKDAGAKLLDSDSRLAGDFKMASHMTYNGIAPIVTTDNDYGRCIIRSGIIRGELYEVDSATLSLLDQYEGHPEVYERQRLTIDYNGKATKVWVYIFIDTDSQFSYHPTMNVIHAMVKITDNQELTVSTYTWRGL